jgi:tetratricopeptide (TPR) repeat protein
MLLSRRRLSIRIPVVAGLALAVLLSVRTFHQIPVWRDNATLFTHCISIHPTPLAYNNRGTTYGKAGAYNLAIEDFTKAIEMQPDAAGTYHNRARAYYVTRRFDLARRDLERTIELDPEGAAGRSARLFLQRIQEVRR